jgi:hypothetical protein
MSRFKAANERSFEPIQIVGGPKTKGIILHPPNSRDPGVDFASPRITLRVRPDSLIRPGQVIHSASGYFIVAEYNRNADYTNHTLYAADRVVPWTRTAMVVDPVSLLTVKTGPPTLLGNIRVMWQRQRRELLDLSIRMSQETTLTVTGSNVQIGDYLDGIRVVRRSDSLGVVVLELQA